MVMIPIIAGVLLFYITPESSPPFPSGRVENPVGMSAAKDSNGDWLISIMSGGGQNLKDVTLHVMNTSTGAIVLNTKLNAIPEATGAYNDNIHSGQSKVNAGDSILLKSGGPVLAGMRVLLRMGKDIIGNIKELPA
jgi:hypothetical protein